jgi:hypothetical protein
MCALHSAANNNVLFFTTKKNNHIIRQCNLIDHVAVLQTSAIVIHQQAGAQPFPRHARSYPASTSGNEKAKTWEADLMTYMHVVLIWNIPHLVP